MTETPQNAPRISRRSIAKGAAWAAPVVIASQSVAAYATSGERTAKGNFCKLFFGTGNLSSQRMDVHLGFADGTPATIPTGTVVTWNVKMDASEAYDSTYTQIPVVSYSGDPNNTSASVRTDDWVLETGGEPGDTASSFTVTWTALKDVQRSSVDCGMYIIWNDSDSYISPGVKFSISSGTGKGKNSLSFKVPQRRSTSKSTTKALIFEDSSTGCYPAVNYSSQGGYRANQSSNGANCGSQGENNTSTVYPGGVCKMVQMKGGQAELPARCA